MLQGKKYRIFPNEQQKQVLQQHFEGVRCVYNLALETKTRAYSTAGVNLSRYDLQVQLKDLKKDCGWLKNVNSQSTQVALMNLDAAYLNFFKGGGFPNFKKKKFYNKFCCPQNFTIEENKLYIPKLKTGIKIKLHRNIDGIMKSVVISKNAANQYFASILVEDGIEKPTKKEIKYETSVGFDLGIKKFLVASDGTEYENPKYLKKSLKRLKCLQRRLSRKKKGSNNRKKAILKVAKLHNKISNQRLDTLHKVSNEITNRYDTLCFEDLAVKNMAKNHKLAQSISDCSWGKFTEFVKYKAEKKGKNYIEINRFLPSSKMCGCGSINQELTLKDRDWTCKSCGTTNQRDFLAAQNIRNFAIINSGVERPIELVELPTIVGTMTQEAHTPLCCG